MIEYPMLFGSLLLAVGCAAIACALYATRSEYRQLIHKIYFALCISLLLWGSGLAVMVSAANEELSTLGGRIAPIGYCTMFGFMLHYVMLLTRRTAILKKWWSYILIYAPGAISLFGFTILPMLRAQRYKLLETPLGWVNVSMNSWVWFYYVYYSSFVLLSMFFLWRWGRNSTDVNIRKQSLWLLVSLFVSITLGSITDIGLVFLGIRMPSIAAIFSFLPIFAISYSVKRYGLMRVPRTDERAIILDQTTRSGIYRILSLYFAGGSLLNLLSQRLLYQEEMLPSVYWFSILLLAVAGIILLLNRLKMEDAFQELLMAFLICFFVPFITLRFYIYGSITIWTVFFGLVVISLLFNQRILLISVLLTALLSQLVVWDATPIGYFQVDTADYLVRLGLIVLTSVLCVFINRVYRSRLKENSRHVTRQALVSEISKSFISANEENFDEKVVQMLELCGTHLQCDRAYLALVEEKEQHILYSSEWLTPGMESHREQFEQKIWGFFPLLADQLQTNQPLVFADTAVSPEGLAGVQPFLMQAGVHGVVTLPIRHGDKAVGFMSFSGSRPATYWNLDTPAFLSIIANTVGDAVAKIEDVKHIRFVAYHDQLTGLPNRLLLKDRLDQAIQLALHTGKMIGVVFMDLDTFKTVNDTMGHDVGDRILQEIAHTISAHIRSYDTLVRFGGDEFVLLLDQISSRDDLLRVMDKLMETMQNPFMLDGQEIFVTGSVGVAICPQDGIDAETLIKNADLSMYHAKAQGKNRYVMCSMDMKDKAVDQMRLTNLLYRALERSEFVVYYQPQVNLETRQVVGLEALLRWVRPGQEMISPMRFIPLAEQTGLIQPIGAWVLQSACNQAKQWQNMGLPAVRIAVNISLQQLTNKNFPLQVAEVLSQSGLSAEYLELEVTESIANSQVKGIVDMLKNLKTMGVSLSIDDFGTEYSSLSRLKLLPVDRLKLDMQFIHGIETSEKDRAITKVIISLAKSLNLKVIAEGVETAPQLEFLSQKFCDEVQGFYYYKPIPAQEVEKILRANYLAPYPAPGGVVSESGEIRPL